MRQQRQERRESLEPRTSHAPFHSLIPCGQDLFFLCEGEVEVVRGGVEAHGELKETILARRTPVSFFGEFAALQLGGARRSLAAVG